MTWAVMAIVCIGCADTAQSPLDHFKETQSSTMTPHGAINTETAKAGSDGEHIEYETDDGSAWRVKATKSGRRYRYSNAEQLEK